MALALGDDSGRVWIVDPLDGTREYSEGREDWAVHVALAVDGAPRVGAVALPAIGAGARDRRSAPSRAPGVATPDGGQPEPAARIRPRSWPIGWAPPRCPWARPAPRSPPSSAGEAEVYVHAGGQYEWDSAAPVAVALAGGFHASRLDGSPLRYSRPDPWLPDLVVCHPDLTDAVHGALRDRGPPA